MPQSFGGFRKREREMKKEYVAPEYRSLQYVFTEEVATGDDLWGDLEAPLSSMIPKLP